MKRSWIISTLSIFSKPKKSSSNWAWTSYREALTYFWSNVVIFKDVSSQKITKAKKVSSKRTVIAIKKSLIHSLAKLSKNINTLVKIVCFQLVWLEKRTTELIMTFLSMKPNSINRWLPAIQVLLTFYLAKLATWNSVTLQSFIMTLSLWWTLTRSMEISMFISIKKTSTLKNPVISIKKCFWLLRIRTAIL